MNTGEVLTEEQRHNMVNFIKRTFGESVNDDELTSDDQIKKIYNEAVNYSDWGL
ncbi:hypothetical protein H7K28_15005 [Paenibacillus polymyxa]|jgi:hypothetical protein|nr:hypothetical protein [Paenibacillus polymyxa]MBY0020747.1 hypothetical protein [Paenibacillus polymyxa]MBY0024517.1 hypothetical protein [Paenibacillus polymyxa]MBY0058645.1 hypothetical protein [Paenibacillus polymyxa]MBY0059051.1 hypothetical protein [Paenibacillus polymyxa]MBY0069638.1 hypothetical protein [Paenibacillus polymyxa]